MHGQGNYPFNKCNGDLDVPLPNGLTDEPYLACLHQSLENELPLADADIVFYLAGADPYEHDRLGKLKLTKAGLAERDRLVFAACRRYQLPIAVVMAGGYARVIDDVVTINVKTISTLLRALGRA